MWENLITMVRMICFSYKYSQESGYSVDLKEKHGVSPEMAMELLFSPMRRN